MDRDLIIRARDGDRQAFTQLAVEVSDRLFAVALRVLRDRDAAGDALQIALVAIWRDLPQLRDPDRFEAWSYRVLINSCRSGRRKARRSVITVTASPIGAITGDSQGAVAQRDELERAFRTLTPDQRTVLVLLYYRDMTVSDAAEVLGVSIGTVKSRAHHARRSMHAALAAQERSRSQEGRPA